MSDEEEKRHVIDRAWVEIYFARKSAYDKAEEVMDSYDIEIPLEDIFKEKLGDLAPSNVRLRWFHWVHDDEDLKDLEKPYHLDFSYIIKHYPVKPKIHGRIRFNGEKPPRLGTIVGSCGKGLEILLDGDILSRNYHPTWALDYLENEEGGPNPALLQENLHFLVHETDCEGSVYGLVQDFPDKDTFLNTVKFYLGDQGYTGEEVKFLEVQRDFYKFKHTYVEYADGDIVESEDPVFTRTEESEEGSIEAYFVYYETKPGRV